ncbi:hypothetical protein F511_15484 [Dorcoceras hygrometricum]|uniref:Dystroglycan-like n=1 Tax=Dorcoceras hygrometricum TaxID=472368 RepID=A0A2Z7CR41_9LAMI|nr:hypothetical protein F511_15484 [Dorcoceras hygrometricum]
MASSLFTNTLHISFDSVLTMDHEGMVAMFEALVATGLKDFLGCPGVIYEDELIEFFQNGSIRDGMVVSTINGKTMEISEELFAETFQLPVEGLTDMNDVPKDVVSDARSVFSYDGTQIESSGKKRKMKFEFRLLNDILAKSVTVKPGSFDAVTLERFLMMAAINGAGSRQAKGFSIQIILLLEDFPNLELGDSLEFPSSRILTERTIHRYIVINDKVGIEEVADITRVKKTPKKKAVSRKIPAVVTGDEPAVKKKRTSKSKSVSLKDNLEILPVAQEAVPLQRVAPTMEDEPVVESSAEEVRTTSADDVDIIIEQVIAETAQLEMDEGEPDVSKTDVGAQETHRAGEPDQWFNLSYEVLYATDRPVETASDTYEDIEPVDEVEIAADEQSARSSSNADVDSRRWCISAYPAVASDQLLVALSKDFDDKLADIRNELLEFRVETQVQLASLGTHLAELIAFLTKGSDDKRGEDSSIRRPQPPPDDQNRPGGGSGSRPDDHNRYGRVSVSRDVGTRGSDSESRRRGDQSGSKRKRSSGGGESSVRGIFYGLYLPPKRDAEYWITGKK